MDLDLFTNRNEICPPCPRCSATVDLESIRFSGMPILLEAHCSGCGHRYWLDWPAGHSLLHPTIIDANLRDVYAGGGAWYTKRVVRCLQNRRAPLAAAVTVRGEQRHASAIVLNCLDFIYGHAVLKLLSAPRHLRESPDADVVIVIHRGLAWMAPGGTRTVEVDLPFSAGDRWVEGLDEAMADVLAGYQEVTISPAVSQPDVIVDDLAAIGIPPVGADVGARRPLQVTFAMRDDRLWLGGRHPVVSAARRLLAPKARALVLRWRQRQLYTELAARLRRWDPTIRIVAVGLGSAEAPRGVENLRRAAPTIDDERTWLDAYRASAVVVGIHGSNMLLPSALGAAVVELLPVGKLPHLGEDLIVPGGGAVAGKRALLRYRVLPATTGPQVVADTIVSIVRDAQFQRRNFIENRRAYDHPGWPRPVSWHRVESGARTSSSS